MVALFFREKPRFDLVEAKLAADGLGIFLLVAGEELNLDAEGMEAVHHLLRLFPDDVVEDDIAFVFAIDGQMDDRPFFLDLVAIDAKLLH